MKKTLIVFLSAFLLATVAAEAQNAQSMNPKPFTVPEVQQWKGGKGVFTPTNGLDDPRITFTLKKDKKVGAEGYTITITPKGVTATAPTEQGLRWSRQTLLQLLELNADGTLPCGTIRDWPDYALRGFMLDCGRKFIPIDYLHNLIEMMAYYKMNTLQLHLNDNGFDYLHFSDWNQTYAAFRLESDTYPGLTANDGFYTKQQFIDLQKHAEELGVEIIPEIDVPAHCLAFTHYKPELGSEEFGMDHLDLRKPELVYPFVEGLFKEYLEGDEPVFRGPRVNIGTDEYSNRDSVIVEEFRRFTDHFLRFVADYGKQPAFWGSLTHAKGVTPVKSDGVLMNCWYNGYADPAEMKAQGYELVSIPDGFVYIVPAAGYYYDYLNTQFLYNEWTPAHIGNQVFDECDPAIRGGMFAVWNDHVGNGIAVADIHHRIYPAMQTISAKTWTATHTTFPYEVFDSLRTSLSEAPGINLLGRHKGDADGLVCRQEQVLPGTHGPAERIGWDYTVSFDIDLKHEEPQGAILFHDGDTRFYLSDPVGGRVGFSRDGYLFTFNYTLRPGHHTVAVCGTNHGTTLKVDGNTVSELTLRYLIYPSKRNAQRGTVPTLVFPLCCAGQFDSRVTNLQVWNRIEGIGLK